MSFKITGFDDLQREMELLSKVAEALDGEIANLSFNPNDPTSIERAIADMKIAIDQKVSGFPSSASVDELVANLKQQYEEEILTRAATARLDREEQTVSNLSVEQAIFRQIENTISDLRTADYNSFHRHIKKLSRILHSETLEPFSSKLIDGVNLEAWIKAGEETQGSMVGSADLDWPGDPLKELGLVILLIDKFADDSDAAFHFSHTFYYAGSKFTANIQNMTTQMIVPFARDYIDHVKTQTGTVEQGPLPTQSGPAARKVFIVHGHDEGTLQAVARFLEQLQFEAIILHEQASKGRTIIEKIEAHGEVGFAIILLTPDDVGSARDEDLQPRARQNVLLELGYFLGRLGRSRVCALKLGELEVPSDFDGVVYVPFDNAGAWKQALSRELQETGFDIDWNVAMKL